MIIYYTTEYAAGKGESHRLLEEAIALYLYDKGGESEDDCLAGRGDARERAARLVGGMKTGEKGKPYIDGFGHFSISHSGNTWAVLIAGAECGLDIQYERKCDMLPIADRWYAPADAEAVRAAMEEGADRGAYEFFRLWTRREALAKALGGAVCDTTLPPVCDKSKDLSCQIRDIRLPGIPELHAAVCAQGTCIPDIGFVRL